MSYLNKDDKTKYNKKHYKKNKQKINDKSKQFRQDNPDKIKLYYEKHKSNTISNIKKMNTFYICEKCKLEYPFKEMHNKYICKLCEEEVQNQSKQYKKGRGQKMCNYLKRIQFIKYIKITKVIKDTKVELFKDLKENDIIQIIHNLDIIKNEITNVMTHYNISFKGKTIVKNTFELQRLLQMFEIDVINTINDLEK